MVVEKFEEGCDAGLLGREGSRLGRGASSVLGNDPPVRSDELRFAEDGMKKRRKKKMPQADDGKVSERRVAKRS
jgi:hypothetical protein